MEARCRPSAASCISVLVAEKMRDSRCLRDRITLSSGTVRTYSSAGSGAMLFMFTAKPESVHFATDVSITTGDDKPQTARRRLYFVAMAEIPGKIRLATGPTLTLAHAAETTLIWVSIWQEDTSDPHKDVIDNNPSFIHVSPKEKDHEEDHIDINIVLGAAQFDDTLRAFREGKQIMFTASTKFQERVSTATDAPVAITYDGFGWHREGDSILWRNDLKSAVAIRNLTINITLPVPEASPAATDAYADDTREVPVTEEADVPIRRFDVATAADQSDQSFAVLVAGLTAAHRALSTKITWIVVLLVFAVVVLYFRR